MKKQALNQSIKYIKSWLQFSYDRNEIPGYVVAISYKGKVVLNEAYGFADLENKTQLKTDHIFRIASHSKTFTSTALMQLRERGDLQLDDYAVKYLPWLKDHKDVRWQKVTLRQLMSHGAGVIRDGINADYWQLDRPFPSKEVLKKEVLGADLVIDSNVKLKYSNFGYSILGMVIEAITGISYKKYINENIVRTLGLVSTGAEYAEEINNRIVTGYTRRDVDKTRLPIENIDTCSMVAATGFYSTAEEMCKYFTAHMCGSGELLSDESKKEMQRVHYRANTPARVNSEDYGLGLEIEYVKKRKTFGHGGGFPGQSTKSIVDPEDEMVVVVLTNCIDGPGAVIAKGIYSILDFYEEKIYETKSKHDLSDLEGRYMSLWGIIDIVATGDKMMIADPQQWQPFSFPEELEYVNENTFKIIHTDSFSAEDELVHFNIENGKVTNVIHSGSLMLPEADWLNKQKSKKIVSLSSMRAE